MEKIQHELTTLGRAILAPMSRLSMGERAAASHHVLVIVGRLDILSKALRLAASGSSPMAASKSFGVAPRHTIECDCSTCDRYSTGIFVPRSQETIASARAFRQRSLCCWLASASKLDEETVMRELSRFVLGMLLGVLDASWCLGVQQIHRVWAPGDELWPAITIGFRFCLWSAAAVIAISGRQGARDGR